MDRVIQQLLESQVLSEDVKNEIAETFDKKIAEARQTIQEQTRKEFAQRYDHDKTQLVEAMDKFLGDQVRKEIVEFHEERKAQSQSVAENKQKVKEFAISKLREEIKELSSDQKAVQEERVKLSKAVMESKKVYDKKLKEHMNVLQKFVLGQLSSELKEFSQDKKSLAEERKELHKQLRESRLTYKNEFVNRVNKLEKFVIGQLTEEVAEFEQDKRLLAEERVKFHTESKSKLAEAKSAFIKKAAQLVEATAHKTIRSELEQLKDDLKVARANNFGRRIFEAYAAEYMTSYLSEGTEVRKVQKQMDEVKQQLSNAAKVIAEQKQAIDSTKRKVQLAEDRATRTKILSDLLSPLPREQKMIMGNLLENVKTTRIEESFKRYLPNVLKETQEDFKPTRKTTLVEDKVSVTGDRKNRLSESVDEEAKTGNVAEILELRKLAGIVE